MAASVSPTPRDPASGPRLSVFRRKLKYWAVVKTAGGGLVGGWVVVDLACATGLPVCAVAAAALCLPVALSLYRRIHSRKTCLDQMCQTEADMYVREQAL